MCARLKGLPMTENYSLHDVNELEFLRRRINYFVKDTRHTERDCTVLSLCVWLRQNRSWRYALVRLFATVFILRFRATSIDIHLRSSDQLLAQLWKDAISSRAAFYCSTSVPFQFRRSIAVHERFIIPIFCYRTCLPASRINLSCRFQQNFPQENRFAGWIVRMHLSRLFAENLKALEIKIFSRKYYHEYIYVRTIVFSLYSQ